MSAIEETPAEQIMRLRAELDELERPLAGTLHTVTNVYPYRFASGQPLVLTGAGPDEAGAQADLERQRREVIGILGGATT